PAEIALIDGRPGIAIAVRMEPDRRVDQWAAQARDLIAQMRRELPRGIALRLIFDQSRYVSKRLASLQMNLMVGALLVVLVIFVMMGWKSALLVGSALPLTSLMVLTGMRQLNLPIHQMSVTGLIVALGMLIDNAIITVDEVRARLAAGKAAAQAVAESVRYLLVPLLGSTLTTVLAFMPLVLMPGGAGEFVRPIGISVILALFSSFFVALTVVAALTGLAYRTSDRAAAPAAQRGAWWRVGVSHAGLSSLYKRSLELLYARPLLGVLLALVLPIAGFGLSAQLEKQFFPPSDRDQFQIQLRLPSSASIDHTQRVVRDLNGTLRDHPQIQQVHWFLGTNAPKFYYNMLARQSEAPYYAQAMVQLRSSDGVFALIRTLQAQLDRRFPEAQAIVKQLEQGPPFNAPIEMHLYGPDLDRLQQLGDRVRAILAQVPEVIHTQSTLQVGRPKLWLQLDVEEARLAGLDNIGVATQLQQSLEGVVGGSLLEGTEELPVRVRLASNTRREVAEIASLDLMPQAGTRRARLNGMGIPVQAVGQIGLVPEVASISHRDGERVATIQGFITAGVLPSTVLKRFQAQLHQHGFTLPAGYRSTFGGEADERNEAVGNLLASVGVLLVLMLATLVLSFNSFRLAALIAMVAGLSAGLSLLSLWLFDYPFGFTAIVGTMGLVGVAVNDAIVVLAAIREHPRARTGDRHAVQAVVLRSTRHVIATTVTTIAGFTPLLLGGGGFWPPLAVAIAGGVAGATLLALYFVPSAYILLVPRRAREQAPETVVKAVVPA
ncbi:MAG: efflux RND transporter permease subunit, partial [Candidatus Tectomicrobia bacterium]